MYKLANNQQVSFFDFNQSCGIQLNENNEWVVLANRINWDEIEKQYAQFFPSHTGKPAKTLRMALGALIIQTRKQLSDRALVKEIEENPYLQYFIGVTNFQQKCPFGRSALFYFRKRLSVDFIMKINELYIENAESTPEHINDKEIISKDGQNIGTIILDATCSPSNIKYPQDFVLLNTAREKLETIIDYFNKTYRPWAKPRTYREVARKKYLAVAKNKKRTESKLRSLIRVLLGCVKRDIGYIEKYLNAGYEMPNKYQNYYQTIQKLYEQQKYMYQHHTHTIENRIVSISQPFVRPIVRGKVKAPVEFGAKYDISVDEKGHARLEHIQFDPYNESTILQHAVETYRKRTGHYPVRVLVDQIYRTRENREYCKKHGIRMSGPKLGRPSTSEEITKTEAKIEYQDNTDRIEVERFFSNDKQNCGAGIIKTKLEETSLSAIALTILVANMFSIPLGNFFIIYLVQNDDIEPSYSFILFEDE